MQIWYFVYGMFIFELWPSHMHRFSRFHRRVCYPPTRNACLSYIPNIKVQNWIFKGLYNSNTRRSEISHVIGKKNWTSTNLGASVLNCYSLECRWVAWCRRNDCEEVVAKKSAETCHPLLPDSRGTDIFAHIPTAFCRTRVEFNRVFRGLIQKHFARSDIRTRNFSTACLLQ